MADDDEANKDDAQKKNDKGNDKNKENDASIKELIEKLANLITGAVEIATKCAAAGIGAGQKGESISQALGQTLLQAGKDALLGKPSTQGTASPQTASPDGKAVDPALEEGAQANIKMGLTEGAKGGLISLGMSPKAADKLLAHPLAQKMLDRAASAISKNTPPETKQALADPKVGEAVKLTEGQEEVSSLNDTATTAPTLSAEQEAVAIDRARDALATLQEDSVTAPLPAVAANDPAASPGQAGSAEEAGANQEAAMAAQPQQSPSDTPVPRPQGTALGVTPSVGGGTVPDDEAAPTARTKMAMGNNKRR